MTSSGKSNKSGGERKSEQKSAPKRIRKVKGKNGVIVEVPLRPSPAKTRPPFRVANENDRDNKKKLDYVPKRGQRGYKALQEIKKLQKSSKETPMINPTRFKRLVRQQVLSDVNVDGTAKNNGITNAQRGLMRFRSTAIQGLQQLTEAYINSILVKTLALARFAGRKRIMEKDLQTLADLECSVRFNIDYKAAVQREICMVGDGPCLEPENFELDDDLQALHADIRRLCLRAGIRTIQGVVFPAVRVLIKAYLSEILDKAIVLVSAYKRRIVTLDDISQVVPIATGQNAVILPAKKKKKSHHESDDDDDDDDESHPPPGKKKKSPDAPFGTGSKNGVIRPAAKEPRKSPRNNAAAGAFVIRPHEDDVKQSFDFPTNVPVPGEAPRTPAENLLNRIAAPLRDGPGYKFEVLQNLYDEVDTAALWRWRALLADSVKTHGNFALCGPKDHALAAFQADKLADQNLDGDNPRPDVGVRFKNAAAKNADDPQRYLDPSLWSPEKNSWIVVVTDKDGKILIGFTIVRPVFPRETGLTVVDAGKDIPIRPTDILFESYCCSKRWMKDNFASYKRNVEHFDVSKRLVLYTVTLALSEQNQESQGALVSIAPQVYTVDGHSHDIPLAPAAVNFWASLDFQLVQQRKLLTNVNGAGNTRLFVYDSRVKEQKEDGLKKALQMWNAHHTERNDRFNERVLNVLQSKTAEKQRAKRASNRCTSVQPRSGTLLCFTILRYLNWKLWSMR